MWHIISYKYDNDIKNKLDRFQYICGTIRRMLRNTRKDTIIKFFKTMAIQTLLYGRKTWTLKKSDEIAIQFSEMKFLRSVKGCSIMDKIRNEDIRKKLKIMPILVKIRKYRTQWKEHLERMDKNHIPKSAM